MKLLLTLAILAFPFTAMAEKCDGLAIEIAKTNLALVAKAWGTHSSVSEGSVRNSDSTYSVDGQVGEGTEKEQYLEVVMSLGEKCEPKDIAISRTIP